MRAYVITHGWDGVNNVKELVSSKKEAIIACERILEKPGAHWAVREKHVGKCTNSGGEYTSYEMFYVNANVTDGS